MLRDVQPQCQYDVELDIYMLLFLGQVFLFSIPKKMVNFKVEVPMSFIQTAQFE